ncbi:hypothetical protein JXO59_12415, partial [candidate division KSB1 bacterium]|nr:hypothetical protein [candidate division KSB1 bacterium]
LPDPISAQTQAALVMHQHEQPQKILLIEGGLGGLAPELARYNTTRVDYIEMDSCAYALALRHLSPESRDSWRQSNLNVLHVDGRKYLHRTCERYDVILVNIGRPVGAFSNRYYTEEFFALIRQRLQPDGIFAVCGFPSAENFLGPELLQLNAAVYKGLKKIFAHVLVLPGDEAIFLAARENTHLTTNPARLAQRMQSRGISATYFYPQMFAQFMPAERIKFIQQQLETCSSAQINRDFYPIAYYIDLILWHKMTLGASQLLQSLAKIGFSRLLVFFLFLLVVLLLLSTRKKSNRWPNAIMWNSAALGFIGIAFNVLFLLAMQNIFGYVYEGVGLAMAAFMAGMALASWFSHRYLSRHALFYLRLILLATAGLCLALPYLLKYIQAHYSMLLLFSGIVLSGALIGSAFPLLCQQYDQSAGRHQWGSVYAADLAGSAAGSLLLSAILIPLMGFARTGWLLAIAAASGLLMLCIVKHEKNRCIKKPGVK